MRREPNPSELLAITEAVRRGDRLSATSLYISATEAGLTDAQDFIRALTAEERDENASTATKKSS